MSDKFHFKEKGLNKINDILISYSVYPKDFFHKTLRLNFIRRQRIIARFYAKGKVILDDKFGTIFNLKRIAKKHLNMNLYPMEKGKLENSKYVLYSVFSNLENLNNSIEKNRPYYNLLYFRLLDLVFYTYSMFLRVDSLNTIRSFSKLGRFFSETDWNKDYFLPEEYPDKDFVDMFVKCLGEVSHEEIEVLVNYVIFKMGDIDINNWHIKYPLI